MENENLKPVQELTPFTKMIMSIGTLPSSFYASMSYYESMVWLYEYMKNTVIPTINNNAECIEELQQLYLELKQWCETYVTETLPEEVNRKLDEMAEDGTITNLISGYINEYALLTFDTVSDMKQANYITKGTFIKTYGYYEINDGGGSFYKVTDEESETDHQEELENDLYATLIIENDTVNIKQMGAKGNELFDNTTILQSAISLYDSIFIPEGRYLISSQLVLYRKHLFGLDREKSIIVCSGNNGIQIDRETRLNNFAILQNSTNQYTGIGINFKSTREDSDTITRVIIEELQISYFQYGIKATEGSSWSNTFRNLIVTANTNSIYFDALEKPTSSSDFANIFDSIYAENRNNGSLLYLRYCHCLFLNCNFSCNFNDCIRLTNSNLRFVECHFETDGQIANNSTIFHISGQTISFDSCKFLDNFPESGNNYMMRMSLPEQLVSLSLTNCKNPHYVGSNMSHFLTGGFGYGCSHYGIITANGNDFDLSDGMYNSTIPFVRIDDKPIRIISENVDTTKCSTDDIYLYRYQSTPTKLYKIAMFNGTDLKDLDGNTLT